MQNQATFSGTFAAPYRTDQLVEYGQLAALVQGIDAVDLVFVDPGQPNTEMTVEVNGLVSECYLDDPELEQSDLDFVLDRGWLEEVNAYEITVGDSQARSSFLRWFLAPKISIVEAYRRVYFDETLAKRALQEAQMHASPLCKQESSLRMCKAYRPTTAGKMLLACGDAYKLNYLTADYDVDEMVQLMVAVASNHKGVLFKEGMRQQKLVIAPRYAEDVRVTTNQFVPGAAFVKPAKLYHKLMRLVQSQSEAEPVTRF